MQTWVCSYIYAQAPNNPYTPEFSFGRRLIKLKPANSSLCHRHRSVAFVVFTVANINSTKIQIQIQCIGNSNRDLHFGIKNTQNERDKKEYIRTTAANSSKTADAIWLAWWCVRAHTIKVTTTGWNKAMPSFSHSFAWECTKHCMGLEILLVARKISE